MKNKISDIAVILGKTALGSIPTVGPLVAEIIGNLIPDLRFKRIFSVLEVLESKIDPAEKAKVDQDAIYKTYRANLIRLDLLESKIQGPSPSYEITSLGRLLLRSIDQGGEF